MSTPLFTNSPGHLVVSGAQPHPGPHCIDASISGNVMLLKITANGRNPGAGDTELEMQLTRAQAQELFDAIGKGLRSL